MSGENGGRRQFLKTTGVLTTSLFTGNLRGANDRISAAFIGVGVMGSENLGAAMKQFGVAAVAVCDVYQPNLEKAGALARRQGHQVREVRDFREILADKSIVCISTPDHWHPYMAVEACKAGMDVYVEKPVCLSINEGQKMIQAARKFNRIVQAGTWQRCCCVVTGQRWAVICRRNSWPVRCRFPAFLIWRRCAGRRLCRPIFS